MELQLLSPVLLILVSSYIILQLIFKQRKSPQNNGKLPPSPPKLPVIGHLHLLSGGLPQHVLSELSQRFGHVIHLQLGEISWLVVSSREAAKQVLKEQDPTFAERADKMGTKIMWYDNNDLVYSPYGSHWRQMRRIFVSELLSARNLRSFGLIRQDEMSRLVLSLQSSASAGQAVDLTEKTSAMTCSLICRAAFGREVRESDVLIGLVKKAGTMATGFELADQFPSSKLVNLLSWNKYRLWGMRRRVDAILERIMEEHRMKKKKSGEFDGEDIIDVLLRMQKDNNNLQVPITNNAIKGFIFDVFGAGIESSSNTINWAMVELMRNSAAMAKAQAEVREVLKGKGSVDDLKYLKSVVKETLRLHPPIPLNLRQCREECEVNGYTIHKKTRVAVNVWSMGRDPMYWDEPEMFRPERFDDICNCKAKEFMGNDMEFIPFGAGRRMCPAVNFGAANVEAPLAQLLYHFDWQLPKPKGIGMNGIGDDIDIDIDMAETESFFGSRKTPLLLLPTPYTP